MFSSTQANALLVCGFNRIIVPWSLIVKSASLMAHPPSSRSSPNEVCYAEGKNGAEHSPHEESGDLPLVHRDLLSSLARRRQKPFPNICAAVATCYQPRPFRRISF